MKIGSDRGARRAGTVSSRYDNDRRRGIRNRPLGEQSEADMRWQDYMAHEAELWVCRFFRLPDETVRTDRPDRGYDLIIPGTILRADVKWSSTYPGKWYGKSPGYPTLNLSTWKGPKGYRSDLYIFICGEQPDDFDRTAWAFGYAWLKELLAAPIVTGKYGKPYHALGFDYLHALDELLPIYDDIPDVG